jgi:ribose transport system ATP-binding protein
VTASGLASRAEGALALEAREVSKRFGGTQALDRASLLLRPGTVHALLGGNGSGKSTLIKCLAGVYRADSGIVRLPLFEGPAAGVTPSLAHQSGLRVVHQDLGLFDGMTVAENFALDSGFPTVAGRIKWRDLEKRVGQLLDEYEIPARPRDPVGRLRPAERTLVAIARALQDQRDSEHVLLLDEPTASLPEHESSALLASIRGRAAAGQTVVLVSHRLSEVMEVSDEITVFRDGRVVGNLITADTPASAVVRLIAGREVVSGRTGARSPYRVDESTPALSLAAVTAGPVRDVDLTVWPGEIVGVAGLLGSGRSSLLRAVFGALPRSSGDVQVNGHELRSGVIAGALRAGVALVPEHRLSDAALTTMTVRENMSVSVLSSFWRLWMRRGAEQRSAAELTQRFQVKTAGVESAFMSLSGGNQQKVILARWLRRKPVVLLLDEPTQGVDVGAREEIYERVRDSAARGCGVLVSSSDHEELASLCHRVIVLEQGRIVAHLDSGFDSSDITHAVQSHQAMETLP